MFLVFFFYFKMFLFLQNPEVSYSSFFSLMQPCGVGMDGHDPRTSKGINVAQGPDVSHVPNGTGRGEGSGD